MHNVLRALSVFLTSIVEALTIVLAIFVAILGQALTLMPINALRHIVGGAAGNFLGLQWLRTNEVTRSYQ